MPTCEMCGKTSEEIIDAVVEGTILSLCKECSKFGKVVAIKKPVLKEEKRTFGLKKDIEEPEEMIVPDYAKFIKKAREKLNLKQEEVAKQIAEKESVIHNLETGNLIPTIKLARKLEQFLKIKIIIKTEKQSQKKFNLRDRTLTIGDLIKIKKDRNL